MNCCLDPVLPSQAVFTETPTPDLNHDMDVDQSTYTMPIRPVSPARRQRPAVDNTISVAENAAPPSDQIHTVGSGEMTEDQAVAASNGDVDMNSEQGK